MLCLKNLAIKFPNSIQLYTKTGHQKVGYKVRIFRKSAAVRRADAAHSKLIHKIR